MNQINIIKLEDKDLQLRYILGGINTEEKCACISNKFWFCDVKCQCSPVTDDERLEKVKNFINEHNISNSTFLRLLLTHLRGKFVPYNGSYGPLIEELDIVTKDYNFKKTIYGKTMENEYKEKELLEMLKECEFINRTSLTEFLLKYSLTATDFLVLAKTSLNYRYSVPRNFEIVDLSKDLRSILYERDLVQSIEFVRNYQNKLEEEKQVEENVVEKQQAVQKQETVEKPKSLFKRFQNVFRRKQKKSFVLFLC